MFTPLSAALLGVGRKGHLKSVLKTCTSCFVLLSWNGSPEPNFEAGSYSTAEITLVPGGRGAVRLDCQSGRQNPSKAQRQLHARAPLCPEIF